MFERIPLSENRKFVRDIVMEWFNNRFFPEQTNMTIFDKCILLFDKGQLHNIAENYITKLKSNEKHWIEYIHSIFEEIRFNFMNSEIEEAIKKYNITQNEFKLKLNHISGFIQTAKTEIKDINNTKQYIDEQIDKLDSFYSLLYTSEIEDIFINMRYSVYNLSDDELRKEIINRLDSKEIPTFLDDPLLHDRVTDEEAEEMGFGHTFDLEILHNRKMKPVIRRKHNPNWNIENK